MFLSKDIRKFLKAVDKGVGEQKKVALLTFGMASRLGAKLVELAQWSIEIR